MNEDIKRVQRAIDEAKQGVSALALKATKTDRQRLLVAREELCNAEVQVEMCEFMGRLNTSEEADE